MCHARNIPNELVVSIWYMAGEMVGAPASEAHCQCTSTWHLHDGACGQILVRGNREQEQETGWFIHRIGDVEQGAEDSPEHYEILCFACHQRQVSTGQSGSPVQP